MNEDGTETVATAETVIGVCRGEMLDAMTKRDLDGIGISLKDAMIVAVAGKVLVSNSEATAMNLHSKWEAAIGKRVLVHHPRRRSPRQT